MAQKVLGHFPSAQVVGITATPFRSDKQELATYYQTVNCEIGLVRFEPGWASCQPTTSTGRSLAPLLTAAVPGTVGAIQTPLWPAVAVEDRG